MKQSLDADRYRSLVEQADVARRTFDELLLNPMADPDELETARQTAEELERLRTRAARYLAATRRSASPARVAAISTTPSVSAAQTEPDGALASGSRRDQVGAALDLLGAPARTAELANAVVALSGVQLSPSDLVQLRREEQRQWERAQSTKTSAVLRPWYVVPAISADTLAPAPGTFALSSWPLPDRLITPVAPRLWASKSAAHVARWAQTHGAAAPMLRLLALLARGAPWGSMVWSRQADLSEIEQAADKDAEHLSDRHTGIAAQTEARVQRMDDPAIALWGLPRPRLAEASG